MDIRVSKQIAAPVDLVFDVFSDIKQAESRLPGITKIEILSDIDSGVGTRWRETRIMFGREATEEMEISALEPNKSYDVVAESRGVKYHSRYTFTEQNGGTQVDMVFSGEPTTLSTKLMSMVSFLFAGATRNAMEADMDALKAVCESMADQA